MSRQRLDVSMPWRRFSSSDNELASPLASWTNAAIINVSGISRSPQCRTGSFWNGPVRARSSRSARHAANSSPTATRSSVNETLRILK